MLKWIKKLFYIVANYSNEVEQLRQTNRRMQEKIRELTTVNASVDVRSGGKNHIIVVGRYNKVDYVEVYTLPTNDFAYLVGELNCMKKQGRIGVVDAAPQLRGYIKSEL